MPGLAFLAVGLFVLAGWRRMANFFTDMQQRDKLSASRHAALFQRINTLLFGLFLVGLGLAMMLRWP